VLWRFSRHGVSVRVEVLCSPRAQQEPRCLWFGHWPIVATLGVQSNFVFTEFSEVRPRSGHLADAPIIACLLT